MRLALDTNTVVSGLLWRGLPRQLLESARQGDVTLFISPALMLELAEVLDRPKFQSMLQQANTTASELASDYGELAQWVYPAHVATVVQADSDDDEVVACAVAAGADSIVSGDKHLLVLGTVQGIPVITARAALAAVGAHRS
jgi:putative PIN family toxin of toxin-antitoxin system